MNEIFIYLEDITVSPGYLKGWRIFKVTAFALGPKNFQEFVFKAVKNRKRCGLLIACRSDRLTEVFLQDKVTLFETMMTTMNEANRDKTKVPD